MKINKVMEGRGTASALPDLLRALPPGTGAGGQCPQCGIEWRISWPYPKTAVCGSGLGEHPLGIDEKI
jgi:hypothetical protein